MADSEYKPVPHDHDDFLEKASKRKGFKEAYEALEDEYRFAHGLLSARAKASGSDSGTFEGCD